MDLEKFAALSALTLCAFAGSIVSAFTGFGGAVVFLAFAAPWAEHVPGLDLKHVILLGIARSLFSNPITIYLGGREHLELATFGVMLPGLLLGAPIGQALLWFLSAEALRSLVGGLCLLVAAERLANMSCARLRPELHGSGARTASLGVTLAAVSEDKEHWEDEEEEEAQGDEEASGRAAVSAIASRGGPLPAEHSVREAACSSSALRFAAAALTGITSGILGGSVGTSGIPVAIFVAYFPLHKTATRSLVSLCGLPPQTFAMASFYFMGAFQPLRDAADIFVTTAASAAGIAAGHALHKRCLNERVVLWLLLAFLVGCGCELLSEDWLVRGLCILALGALAVAPSLYARPRATSSRSCGHATYDGARASSRASHRWAPAIAGPP